MPIFYIDQMHNASSRKNSYKHDCDNTKKNLVVEDHNAMVLYLFTRSLIMLKKTQKCLMF